MSDSVSIPIKVSADENAPRVRFEVSDVGPALDFDREISRDPTGLAYEFHLDEVCEIIGQVAQSIGKGLERLKAKRTVVEFGVEIGAEAGHLTALIVKGTGKANLKVTVEWG